MSKKETVCDREWQVYVYAQMLSINQKKMKESFLSPFCLEFDLVTGGFCGVNMF